MSDNDEYTKLQREAEERDRVYGETGYIPEGYQIWDPGLEYVKVYNVYSKFLLELLSVVELSVLSQLIHMTTKDTNILPFTDNLSMSAVSTELGVGKNTIKKVLNRLYELGVYTTSTTMYEGVMSSFWILNPYLAFNGEEPSKNLCDLFKYTCIAKLDSDPLYYQKKLPKPITYTYLMEDDKRYKIGKSTNVSKRFSSMTTSNIDLTFIGKCTENEEIGTLEGQLHKKYADKNIIREWFNLTNKDVKDILELFRLSNQFSNTN